MGGVRMKKRVLQLCLILAGLAAAGGAAEAVSPSKTAVFPFEMVIEQQMTDMGLPPVASEKERERLKLVTRELAELLAETGRYAPLDLATVNSDIEEKAPFHDCNGCEADVAKKAGADLSVLGVVQKASEMLLNVSIFIRNASDGTLRNSMAVSIRENSDDGWRRAVRWLVRNRLSGQEQE